MRSSNSCDSSSPVTRLVLMKPPSVVYVSITGLDLNTLLGWLPGRSDARSQSADTWNAPTHKWNILTVSLQPGGYTPPRETFIKESFERRLFLEEKLFNYSSYSQFLIEHIHMCMDKVAFTPNLTPCRGVSVHFK